MIEQFSLETPQGPVSAIRHSPEEPCGTMIALTHGAGGDMNILSLVRYAEACARGGFEVVRFNQPSAEAKKKRPDTAKKVEATWSQIVDQVRPTAGKLLIGGRSFGGRMASHIAAAGTAIDGLIFLAYPLHAPATPEKLRDEHLSQITAPMLFLQGDRDAFAKPDLLRSVLSRLPNASLHQLPGGDHSHRVKGRSTEDVATELAKATATWAKENGLS